MQLGEFMECYVYAVVMCWLRVCAIEWIYTPRHALPAAGVLCVAALKRAQGPPTLLCRSVYCIDGRAVIPESRGRLCFDRSVP